jgi:glucose/arabinose dehydrogenase
MLGALALANSPEARAQTCSASVQRVLVTSATTAPVDIRQAPGDSRLFIVEQQGRIRILDNGALLPEPFLDIVGSVAFGGERGLLSLAFHPNYPATPWFFVYYTNTDTSVGTVGDVIVARYSVTADHNHADPSSGKILIKIAHGNASNHNGGQLHFDPADGYLYISVGDGGGGCDNTGSGCNAQRLDLLLGKLLRIDVNRDTAPYYNVPTDNPFAGAPDPQNKIWAKGLRNPFRFAFDRTTNDLWIGDVGQSTREEVDFQPASSHGGENYGWKIMEGTACNTCSTTECPAPVPACNAPSLELPVHEYDRDVGISIIGGYVYRGSRIPALRGCYVFGDYGSGLLWAIDPASPAARRDLLGNSAGLTTFGQDAAGELYFTVNNSIYKLVPMAAPVPASGPWLVAAFGFLIAAVPLVLHARSAWLLRARV